MKPSNFGLEYEPKPSWEPCTQCGARRPPASLKDGKCIGWFGFGSDASGVFTPDIDRCAELAKSKETK